MNAEASLAAKLARFVVGASPTDMPEPIRAKAARHVLDTLACGIAGAASYEATTCLDLTLATEAKGDVPVWGTNQTLSPRSAALVNGVACHAFELDDTGGCDHSGAVVLPAALAAVAMADGPVSGPEFLLAVVLGYDIARRVLEACGGYRSHNEAGWHSTATCGTFGAAVAAARILRLDERRIAHALGHAASFSGGLWAFIHDGSQTKRIHAGRAAEGGLFAAMLARSGISGPSEVFADVWGGFHSTFAPRSAQPHALVEGLGESWRIQRVSLKPYASCRGTHAAIDALGLLVERHHLDVGAVRKIEIRLSRFLFDMCGGRDVSSLAPAQMSLPFALAARLVFGKVGLGAYSATRRCDPSVVSVMDRVELVVDPAIPPSDEPYLAVETIDGHRFENRVVDPLGSPTNPVSDATYFAKVRELALMSLDHEVVDRLVSGVLKLAEDTDMRWLGGALASTRGHVPLFT